MAEYGVDLSEWLAAGRFRHLLELIDQLPATARFHEAIVNDPEDAAAIAEYQRLKDEEQRSKPALSAPSGPRISEHGYTEELLAQVVDSITALQIQMIGLVSKKKPKFKPVARPTSHVQRSKEQAQLDSGVDLFRKMGFSDADMGINTPA